jgi:AcrR family transcriptional regulator
MVGVESRRDQILRTAAVLFARHGFHGVSIAELGAAVGISGPALYRHFPGKEALLAELLVDISERLLAGARALGGSGPREVVEGLVDFQLAFALREPELIVVQDRDLDNLPDADRRRVRRVQRTYVEIWVEALRRLHPDLAVEDARVAAHGAFGLLNSTPYSRPAPDQLAGVLRRMALAALGAL